MQYFACEYKLFSKFILCSKFSRSKGKGLPVIGHEGPEGKQICSSTLPSTSAIDGGGWSMPHPRLQIQYC